MAIVGVMFSEFETRLGPRIVDQKPENLVSAADFKVIEKFLIPKLQLCDRVISIVALGFRILSYPVNIIGKYDRNHLLFNITFFLDPKVDPVPYESVLARLASYIRALETDSGFVLSPTTKKSITPLLATVMADINAHNHCIVAADPANAVHLHVTRPPPQLPSVPVHMVPILLADANTISTAVDDVVLHEVLTHMDGRTFVKRIALQAQLPVELVQQTTACLLAANVAALADVFLYSNIYVVTAAIARLRSDLALQKQCTRYIAEDGDIPDISVVFDMFLSMHPGKGLRSVQTIVESNRHRLGGISIERLIQYGVVKGFLRHIQRYPVRSPGEPDQDDGAAPPMASGSRVTFSNIASAAAAAASARTSTAVVGTGAGAGAGAASESVSPGEEGRRRSEREARVADRESRAAERELKQQRRILDGVVMDGSVSIGQICCQTGLSLRAVEAYIDDPTTMVTHIFLK